QSPSPLGHASPRRVPGQNADSGERKNGAADRDRMSPVGTTAVQPSMVCRNALNNSTMRAA
ncbi:MAG TPA: hypothetical protein VI259_15895, partial [Gemmatimonadaceae bacterium]